MKEKDRRFANLKHEMFQEKGKGKKEVVRKLNENEVEYLEKFFTLEPFLYEIRLYFKPGFNPKAPGVPGVVKGMYYDNWRKHKFTVIKRLTKKEVERCEEFGLHPVPYKYKVRLRNQELRKSKA